MEEITIGRKNLEEAFSNLKATKSLMNIYKKNNDELLYEKYLAEFVGIYYTICVLGLEEEWQEWQIEYDKTKGGIK